MTCDSKWDLRFLKMAAEISTWSKDPSTKVGAVIVDQERHVVSTGYNGFPKGVKDSLALYEDRKEKYPRIIHGDMNALLRARCDLRGHTMFLWPMMPCQACAIHIIQVGITRVVAPTFTVERAARWEELSSVTVKLFREAGVELTLHNHMSLLADFAEMPKPY